MLIKEGQRFTFTGMAKLSLIAFIVSFASALITTIWAVYLDSFLGSTVGVAILSAFLSLIAFSSYFVFIPMVEKYDKANIFFYSLLIGIPLYALIAFATNFYVFFILAFFSTVLVTLRVTSFGIIIKDRSPKGQLSKNEGLLFSFMNLSWVIAPLVAGYVASVSGAKYVFLLSTLFFFFGLVLFKTGNIRDGHVKKNLHIGMKKNFLDFFKNRDRIFAYIIGGGPVMWFSLIYLFIPLYIIRSGLDKLWIGYFLFAISVPLILTEYKFSKMAGKVGFRKMFVAGFIFVAIVSFVCFFVSNIYVLMSLLVLASFGMAMIEPTSEAYFFDVLKKGDASRFYGPYNTRADVTGLVARIFSIFVLAFLPFKFLFILFGLFMIVMVFFAFRMKDFVEQTK